jgi:putative oxidoreductase
MARLLPLVFGSVVFQSWVTDLMIALPRVACGLILAFKFGWSKFPTPQWFIEDVGRLGFPAPAFFAWAAVLTEVFGSLMLAAGFATRLNALLLIITMAVAAFVQKADASLWERLPSLFFLLNAYFALALGSGRFGLDALIRRNWDSRPDATMRP